MKPRDAPYKELTSFKNERITATLTSRAWGKLTVFQTRTAFFGLDLTAPDWVHPDEAAPGVPRPNDAALLALIKADKEDDPRQWALLPQSTLIHEARQSSGSIKGQHRRDLVDALQGVREGKQGLSVVNDDRETEGL